MTTVAAEMTQPRNRARPDADADRLLRQLRLDHSRLSRALREIEVQRARLRSHATEAHPILLDAVQYLLDYQHGFHHPREDRLYRQLAAAQPALRAEMKRLNIEHAHGYIHAGRIATALRRMTTRQAAGRAGAKVARQLQAYVDEMRAHMRREEQAVFYADVGPLLSAAEWRRLVREESAGDPLADPAVLARHYPAFALVLGERVRSMSAGTRARAATAAAGAVDRSIEAAQEAVGTFVDTCGELLHDGIDVIRAGTASVLRAESPIAAVRAVPSIIGRSCRFVRRCIELPSRVTIDSVARVLAPLASTIARPKQG
jgi:hemerythrin-like domain-containing protein